MVENLYLPDIPASPIFIGEEDKIMTIEWQEFFRGLFDRAGGTTAPTVIETDTSNIAELYKVNKDYSKRIDELEKMIKILSSPKSYDKRINELEQQFNVLLQVREPFKFYLPQITYEDLQVSISNIRVPASNAPTERLYDHGIVAGVTFPVLGFALNDYIYFDVQTRHAMKLSTVLDNHIHYVTPTDGTGDKFNFQLDVIVAAIGGSWAVPAGSPFTKEASMVADLSNTHMLEEIADIPASNTTVSTIYKCKLTRIAASADEYAGEIYLEFTDCHYVKNSCGSRLEGSK